ncbi:MAG: uracil-DNA glycosylase family protein [Halobacteriaceae archaeon]
MDSDAAIRANPFGMDEDCQRCDALCATRERVVHGYGDTEADFLFVGPAPTAAAEAAGVPLVGGDRGQRFQDLLGRLGLSHSLPTATEPELENTYLTSLTRCRHPDREPTTAEIQACEDYRTAEIRMINPEILVPIGELTLDVLAQEYTTTPAAELTLPEYHARSIRGRGFELVPMIDPADQSDAEFHAYLDSFEALMARDYRQTKGRRER